MSLSHIRNRDVRLLIISIVFVGIFSMLTEITLYTITHIRVRSNSKGSGGIFLFILLAFSDSRHRLSFLKSDAFCHFTQTRIHGRRGIGRNDEESVGTGTSALRKISADPAIEAVERKDVAQLFIQNPKKKSKSIFSGINGLFATHPPIEKRIEILEQF